MKPLPTARPRSAELATRELLPQVYDDLRRMGGAMLRSERRDHTLDATALVHEAYAKLAGGKFPWQDRTHFLAVVSRAMRQILADHGKAKRTQKRGSRSRRVELPPDIQTEAPNDVDYIEFDETLTRLALVNERHARVVELRFYGGLTVPEVADVLGIPKRTVQLEWRAARAWLRQRKSAS